MSLGLWQGPSAPLGSKIPERSSTITLFILVATKAESEMQEMLQIVVSSLTRFNLVIAPEKVQKSALWHYLGWCILEQSVVPQNLKISQNLKNLNDMQKLLDTINWVHPLLGITYTPSFPY